MTSGEQKDGGWLGRLRSRYDQHRVRDEELRTVTEQVVATADPVIRQASRYRKTLRAPLVGAMDYCRTLVDAIPGPVTLDRNHYHDDPLVKALFASPEQLEEVLRLTPSTRDLHEQGYEGEVVAMMTMHKEEKTIFGHQKVGEIIQRDVAQRAVSFSDHRIIAPTSDLTRTRAGIVNRGMELLATVAMEQITSLKSRKAELREKREYLKGMMKIMGGKNHMLELFALPTPVNIEEFRNAEKRLAEVEAELAQLLEKMTYPEHSLGYLKEILLKPQDSLAVRSQSFRLNWMGVRVEDLPDVEGNKITLAEFSIHDEFRRSAVMVTFAITPSRNL